MSVGAPLGNQNGIGNSGGGAPFGNTNGLGNAGGGAPELNTNGKTHGVWCDLEKIDERAEGLEAVFIDQTTTLIRRRCAEDPGEMARMVALRIVRFDRAVQDIQRRGLTLDDGKANPMVATARRISNRIFEDLTELGAL